MRRRLGTLLPPFLLALCGPPVAAPAAATVTLENLTTGEHLLRAVGPEARVTLHGEAFTVGGLVG